MADPLQRFVDAQDSTWRFALAELQRGRKTSHWMWFVFPQIAGLGQSDMARRYAIASLAEAQAYLMHPTLRARLLEVTAAMAAHAGRRPADAILGGIDAVKFRSSMTLFEAAAKAAGCDAQPFTAAIDAFYGGNRDPETLARLGI